MKTQPLALIYAGKVDGAPHSANGVSYSMLAAELRRLHALNAQMLEALEYVEYFANGKSEWDMVRAAIDAAKGQS